MTQTYDLTIKEKEERKFYVDSNGKVSINITDSELNSLIEDLKSQNDLLRQLLILCNGIQSLNNVDTGGRLNASIGAIAANLTLATVTTIGTVSTMTNLNGSIPSSNIVGELNNIAFQSIRNNINIY